jgi:hypothetical protein
MTADGGRQIPTPTTNPRAQSHDALKAMTDAAQPAGAQAVADGWTRLAAGFDEAVTLFDRARHASEAGWTGPAADAMRAHLARVAHWSKAMGAHYQAAGTAIATQATAAESAKSAMPPPVPYDPAAMIRQARESGSLLQLAQLPFQLYAQKHKRDAAHEEAARVITERDRTMAHAATEIPPFEPPPALVATPNSVFDETAPATATSISADPRVTNTAPNSAEPAASAGARPAGANGAAWSATSPAVAVAPSATSLVQPGNGFGDFGPSGSATNVLAPVPARPNAQNWAAGAGGVKEEGERKRPQYLVQSDLEGMFGSDQLTSPPVIGEA